GAFYPHERGEPDRLARDGVVALAVLAGMQRVARAVERADRRPMVCQLRREVAPRRRALEHAVEVKMRRPGPVSTGEFEHLDAEPGGGCEELVDEKLAEPVGDNADLHCSLPSLEAGGSREAAKMRNPHLGIGQRMRLCRVLLRLDDEPAAIAALAQAREDRRVVDGAIA